MAPALADHDHGNGSSHDHRAASGKSDEDAKCQGEKSHDDKSQGEKTHDDKSQGEKTDTSAKGGTGRQGLVQDNNGDDGQGDERGDGHTPVTVCHLLGNGSYNVLTFDDNALPAHEAHGDLYPAPVEGCPAETSEQPVPGTTPEATTPRTTSSPTT